MEIMAEALAIVGRGGGSGGGGDGRGGCGGALGGWCSTNSRTCSCRLKSDATATDPPLANGTSAKHSTYSPAATRTPTRRPDPKEPKEPPAPVGALVQPPSAAGAKRASCSVDSGWVPEKATS